MNLEQLAEKAGHNRFYRWLISYQLNRVVPFNAPHQFKIEEISRDSLRVKLPYKKRNLNHVKGLHACALATLAEVTSGFLLILKLNPKKYRLILARLEMDYHYQGKTAAYADFSLNRDWLDQNIITPLKSAEKIVVPCEVIILDAQKNHLATGLAHWQIKSWEKVKTKLV